MVKWLNLTPHAIVLRLADGADMTIPPSGTVARVDQLTNQLVLNGDVPILAMPKFGEVVGLPDYEPNVNILVSGLVAEHANRIDVFCPATGPNDGAVRNEKGHIVAVTALRCSAYR